MGVVTALAALIRLGIPSYRAEALTPVTVAAVLFLQYYTLLSLLNCRQEECDETGAMALHKPSGVIHLAQWAAVSVTLVRLSA